MNTNADIDASITPFLAGTCFAEEIEALMDMIEHYRFQEEMADEAYEHFYGGTDRDYEEPAKNCRMSKALTDILWETWGEYATEFPS